MTEDKLRDLLHNRARDGGPGNPTRYDQVRNRVRRLRRRRMAGAGAGAAAAVALTLMAVTAFVSGGTPSQVVAAAPTPRPGMPERFTEDGLEHRLLGTATLSQPRQEIAEVKVPVSGKPIAVAVRCEGKRLATQPPGIRVDGRFTRHGPHLCEKERSLVHVPVPRDREEVTISFETPGLDGKTLTCRGDVKGATPRLDSGQCESPPPPSRADWTFGVYEWTPPATSREPESPPELPETLKDGDISLYRQVAAKSGVWPRNDEVTLTAPYRGKELGVEFACAGAPALVRQLSFEVFVDGESLGGGNCGSWKKGEEFPLSMVEFHPPAGSGEATVKIKWSLGGPGSELSAGDFQNRPVGWSAGVYEQVKDED